MTHDFQSYGSPLPENRAALGKIGHVVHMYCDETSL